MARRKVRWWPAAKTWRPRLASLPVIPMPVRRRILQTVGHRFGPGARLWPGVLVIGSKLTLGREAFVNGGCFIDATGEVTLGDQVHLGPGVQILTTSHEIGPPDRRASTLTVAPVSVGDGTWLGAGSILLPGTTVGAGCVIAAGAVVDGEVPPNTVHGGVPAKQIRALDGH
jgi:acetyltransferase-like isoleucine patch superfamily enzyme